MRFAQKNCAYAHCSHRNQLRLHSHHLHTKQKLRLHSCHTLNIQAHFPRQQSYWNHIKQSVFTAKSQDFLSFLYTNNNQTTPEQCHISAETTPKSHGKIHIKSIFKSPNCIEKHTVFERSTQNHRKTVKHSKFFYKNWETFSGEKFGWKDENFSIKFYSEKGWKLFLNGQNHRKTPLFSRVLACFCSTWNGWAKSNCSTWNICYFYTFPRFAPCFYPVFISFISI